MRRRRRRRTPRARTATRKQNFRKCLTTCELHEEQPQQVLSLVALASPLYSVWLTLSRATLNTTE
jgi:hypothetical protein